MIKPERDEYKMALLAAFAADNDNRGDGDNSNGDENTGVNFYYAHRLKPPDPPFLRL